jgi:hypothetical protein
VSIKTTVHLTLPRELPPALMVAIVVLVLAAGISGISQLRSAQQAVAVPTPALPAPIIIIASPLPVVPPTAVVQVAAVQPSNVTQRAIGVFGAPDTASYIGSVEAGRVFAPVARYGSEWVQVDMDQSGRVFVRTADLYGVPELADLQPTPAPIVVERPIYIAAPLPAVATPAAASAPPTLVPQQAAIYDRQVWAQQAAGR